MAPRLLNDEQKGCRVQVRQDILKELEPEPDMLIRVVTGDESWIFEYDSLNKLQSLKWKSASSPRPKKARLFKAEIKVILATGPHHQPERLQRHLATFDAFSAGEEKKIVGDEVNATSS